MCGRFSLDRNANILEARFKAKLKVTSYAPLFNIGPTMPAACIPQDDPSGIYLFNWGLSEGMKTGVTRNIINARAETVSEKWPFKRLLQKNRCLVLSSGYIEWKLIGSSKIPFLHKFSNDAVFAMAGLFEDSEVKEDGSIQRKFTILTKPAGPQTSGIHDRMPVLLNEAEEKDWLNASLPPEANLAKFLKDPEPSLHIFSISPKINKSLENDPALLLPTPYAVFEQLSLF